MKEKKKYIIASIYLYSKGNKSPLEYDFISARNIHTLLPSQEAINKVTSIVKSWGFEIAGTGVTISIAGYKQLYETIFNIEIFEENGIFNFNNSSKKESKFFNHPLLEEYVAGIEFQHKGILF